MNDIIRYRNRPYLPFEARLPQGDDQKPPRAVSDIHRFQQDIRLKTKELSLNNAVRRNGLLSVIAEVNAFKRWEERLQALGMAITVVNDRAMPGKAKARAAVICHSLPKHPNMSIEADPILHLRGLAFISLFLSGETTYDATAYALALRVGSDAQATILDDNYINGFNTTWNARLATSSR